MSDLPDVRQMRAVIEQALYEAEVDGLLRSAGRIEIAERIAKALTGSTSSSWAFRVYEHTLEGIARGKTHASAFAWSALQLVRGRP